MEKKEKEGINILHEKEVYCESLPAVSQEDVNAYYKEFKAKELLKKKLPPKRFLSSGYLLVQTIDNEDWGYGKYLEDDNVWECNFVGKSESIEKVENIKWMNFENINQ